MKNQLLFLSIFLTTPIFAQEKPDSLVFSEAVEMAQAMLDSMDIDAAILGGETFYGMGNGDGEGKEEDDYREEDRLFFGDMNRDPSIVMGEHEGDGTDPGPGPDKSRMVPDGYAYMWNVYAYDSSVDSLVVMAVDAEGVFDGYMLGSDEADEEVDFSKMKPLPESYIDSDSAMVIASEIGGDRFLDYYSSKEGREYSEWGVELYAIHEYWALPDVIAEDVPVMWVARYFGVSKDMEGWTEISEYSVYMDITTGDTLFTERYVEEFEPEMPGMLFSEAVEMAQEALDSLGIEAVMLGGETSYDYSTQDLDLSELELDHGIHLMPMGYSEWWSIYAYEPSIDSILVLEVEMDGVWEVYTVGEDDMDESIDFSILKALPEDYMDSNELMMMIAESDYDLENFMTDATLPEYAYMDFSMDLRIIHDYWSFPIDLAPELIPVTWNMTLHGSLMDSLDQTMMSDSLSVYIHSTEGELLYASLDLTNSEQENTVPESVVLYQNYPNPFNPTTSISFELNKAQDVSLVVYNLLGQQVLTLVNDRLESGQHRINVNASNLASGIYMYRLITNSQSLTKKMTLIK